MRQADCSIIATDPGKTTGVTTFVPTGSVKMEECGFIEVVESVLEVAPKYQEAGAPLVIACEREVIRPSYAVESRGDQNWSMEVIGCLRFAAIRWGHRFRLYSKSDSIGFASDETLRKLGWHTPGKGHANDAARILAMTMAEVDPGYWKHLVKEHELLDGNC